MVAGGVDLREATAARSLGSHAADRSGGPRVGLLPHQGQSAARSMRRDEEMRIEPRIAPGGGRGEQRRRSARGLSCSRRMRCSRSTRRRGERRARWSQHVDPRRVRRTVSRRCGLSRGSPQEAAVVSSGADPRAASSASRAAVAGAAAGGRVVGAGGVPGGRRTMLRGSTDVPRAGDVDSHRSRPRRQP